MSKFAFIAGLCLIGNLALAQGRYSYTLDLSQVENDELEINLVPPGSDDKEVEFHFPKIVPGTYSIYDFGRFVKSFKAYDKEGSEIKTERIDVNRWKIPNQKGISKINYWVQDTYDYKGDTIPFEPAGSVFDEGKIFVLNTFCMFGYLKGQKRVPYDLSIDHPDKFYGATPLKRLSSSKSMDRFFSKDYYELVDSPLMYCVPDTVQIPLGNTTVELSVYSPNKVLSASEIAPDVETILNAQKSYLGGNLPIERYSILVFLQDIMPPSMGTGALEHSYSTLFTLREKNASSISNMITHVTAHEFFHIITPLTIHSEQIHEFDFQKPDMSQNLWLYEGLTEYAAQHVLIKEGLTDMDGFLATMRSKIRTAKGRFNDTLPFTVMSRGCLDEYESEYLNVYMKGALIGLCLDIKLRELSNGDYGTQELMADLGKRYGAEKPFPDTAIFQIIGEVTYQEIREFLETHVDGPTPLPLEETFSSIGVNYIESRTKEEITLGSIQVAPDPDNGSWTIQGASKMNSFGQNMGFQKGDVFRSVNGKETNVENFREVLKEFKASTKPGEEVIITVDRPKSNGKYKEKTLKAPAELASRTEKHILEQKEELSQEEKDLLRAWGNVGTD